MFDMEAFQHPADAIGKVTRGFVGCDPLDLMQRKLSLHSARSGNPMTVSYQNVIRR